MPLPIDYPDPPRWMRNIPTKVLNRASLLEEWLAAEQRFPRPTLIDLAAERSRRRLARRHRAER